MNRLRSSTPVAIVSLVAANLLPLSWGAGASIASLLFLYWIETWIIAFSMLLKIWKAAAPMTPREERFMRAQLFGGFFPVVSRESIAKVFTAQLFAVQIVYGAVLFGGFVPAFLASEGAYWERVLSALPPEGALLAFTASVLALMVSHGISYATNFLGKQEFLKVSPARQMLQLGDRLLVMHLFIVLGAGIFGSAREGGIDLAAGHAIVGVIFLKLLADLAAHAKEHMIKQAVGPAPQ